MINKGLILLIITFVCLSSSVIAASIDTRYGHWRQTVFHIEETVTIGKQSIHVEFKSIIKLDEEIYNESEFVSFAFDPRLHTDDELIELKENIWAQNFTRSEEYDWYVYAINLSDLNYRHEIHFFAEYNLSRPLLKQRDFDYALMYYTNMPREHYTIKFVAPTNLLPIAPDLNHWRRDRDFNVIENPPEDVGNGWYLLFQDVDEKQEHENIEWWKNFGLNVAFTILGALLGLGFNYLYGLPQKRKWKKIRIKVTSELQYELYQILTDLSVLCDFNQVITVEEPLPADELIKRFDKQIADQIVDFSKNKNVKVDEFWKSHLLEGYFNNLFEKRAQFISRFLTRYLDYLDADTISHLIDMDKALRKIDQIIKIRNKYRDEVLKPYVAERSLEGVKNELQILVDCIKFFMDADILKYG